MLQGPSAQSRQKAAETENERVTAGGSGDVGSKKVQMGMVNGQILRTGSSEEDR